MNNNDESSSNAKYCVSCGVELKNDHIGIICNQGHDICPECSPSFIKQVLSNPEAELPAKCMICKQEFVPNSIERQLDDQQRELYVCYMAMKEIGPDETMERCPFCTFAIITFKTHTMNFFYCQNSKCSKMSCTICHKKIEKVQDDEINEDDYEEVKRAENAEKHFKCWEFKEVKRKFEQCLENGGKQHCPKCNLGGQKDDACTHMTCSSCQQIWCYLCGKSLEELDKSNDGNNQSIYAHNDDWYENERRCPMYLTQINEIDDRWPEDEDQCLQFFHRLQTITHLRKFILKQRKFEEEAIENYIKLTEIFPSCGQACGFTLDTIMKENIKLIKLKRIQYHLVSSRIQINRQNKCYAPQKIVMKYKANNNRMNIHELQQNQYIIF